MGRPPVVVSPGLLAAAGLLVVPAFVFQEQPVIRAAQAAAFVVLAAATGRRVRVLPPVLITIAAVAAHLLVPSGRLLAELGPLKITLGSIRLGVQKATLLVGLVYLSRFSVRSGLVLPGSFGRLLVRMFYYFEQLSREWPRSRGSLIDRLDGVLLAAFAAGSEQGQPAAPGDAPSGDAPRGGVPPSQGVPSGRSSQPAARRPTAAGLGLLGALVLTNYALLALTASGVIA